LQEEQQTRGSPNPQTSDESSHSISETMQLNKKVSYQVAEEQEKKCPPKVQQQKDSADGEPQPKKTKPQVFITDIRNNLSNRGTSDESDSSEGEVEQKEAGFAENEKMQVENAPSIEFALDDASLMPNSSPPPFTYKSMHDLCLLK
jgi:hypothetical protein